MRITAKQIETLATMIPAVSNDNFSFGITQRVDKTSLRVQDGKLSYKLKADGTLGGKLAGTKAIEPQSLAAAHPFPSREAEATK